MYRHRSNLFEEFIGAKGFALLHYLTDFYLGLRRCNYVASPTSIAIATSANRGESKGGEGLHYTTLISIYIFKIESEKYEIFY